MLTLLIPVYNQAPYLADLFNSLLAQDYEDVDLVISDDNSTDRTQQTILDFYPRLSFKFNTVTNVRHIPNLGLSGRNNYKYLLNEFSIRTRYVGALEGDDWLHRTDSLSKRISYLENNESARAVHTDVRVTYEDGSVRHGKQWEELGQFIQNPMTLESQIANNRIMTCSLIAETDLYKKSFNADLFTDKKIFLGDYACTSRMTYLAPGGVHYIDEDLACYRWREHSESHRDRNLVVQDTGHVSSMLRSGELFEDLV